MVFKPRESDPLLVKRRRFRPIPVRMLVPNLITLLALCAGLTAIRLAFEQRLEWAVAAIVFAAMLDGIDDPNRPAWAGNFFVGMPAPAGAITALLPLYLQFLGVLGTPRFSVVAAITFVYTLGIAFLMVSRLPVFSGKRVGKRVSPEMVVPVFVVVVLFFALLVSYPWWVLSIGTLAYLASLPFGVISYRNYERRSGIGAHAAQSDAAAPMQGDSPSLSPAHPASESPPHPDRPPRLN